LKSDVNCVSNGGDGYTNTAAAVDGKVIQTQDVARGQSTSGNGQNDSNDALRSAMRSKGLAGIFDHDFVLNPSSNYFDNVE